MADYLCCECPHCKKRIVLETMPTSGSISIVGPTSDEERPCPQCGEVYTPRNCFIVRSATALEGDG